MGGSAHPDAATLSGVRSFSRAAGVRGRGRSGAAEALRVRTVAALFLRVRPPSGVHCPAFTLCVQGWVSPSAAGALLPE